MAVRGGRTIDILITARRSVPASALVYTLSMTSPHAGTYEEEKIGHLMSQAPTIVSRLKSGSLHTHTSTLYSVRCTATRVTLLLRRHFWLQAKYARPKLLKVWFYSF